MTRAARPQHRAALMTEARELADEYGYNAAQIRRYFEHRGVDPLPAYVTIYRWINDEYRRRMDSAANGRSARRRARRSGGRFRPSLPPTPELRLARMQALRDMVGLDAPQIARLMAFDLREPVSVAWVREQLCVPDAPPEPDRAAVALARMRDLRAAGLTMAAVAKVIRLDFDLELTEQAVRRALVSGSMPRRLRGAALPKAS